MSSLSTEKQDHLHHSSSPYLTESAHVLSLQRPVQGSLSRRASRARRPSPGSAASTPRPAGIIVDTNIETDHGQSDKHDASAWHKLLHHAIHRLKKHKSKNSLHEEVYEDALPLPVDKNAHHGKVIPGLGKTGTWLREEFGSGKRTKKIFGRAPWNRKDSTATFSSVSSSIREVLRGYTPPASPHLAANNAAYFNNKWMTNTFPGGEAMRVSTPPMDEDTADGRPRGFFGPLTPPEPGTADSQTYMTPMTSFASPKYNAHRMSMAVPSREWWEAKPQKSPRHDDPSKVARFEFDIPEHLPNSPMCPANLRHKHGGTGLCVYHGRRRALSTVSDEGPKRRDSKSTC